MKLPPGFKVEVYASDILDARRYVKATMARYLLAPCLLLANSTPLPTKAVSVKSKPWPKIFLLSGIEYHKGNLYLATPKDITVFENIETNLGNIGKGKVIYDKLPGEAPHGWKFIKVGPDNKLYVLIVGNCNICVSNPSLPRSTAAILMAVVLK